MKRCMSCGEERASLYMCILCMIVYCVECDNPPEHGDNCPFT
jgi:hypothetical protein